MKKLFAVALSFVLTLGAFPSYTFAEDEVAPSSSEEIIFTEELASEAALRFAGDFYPDLDLSVEEAIPYCNTEGDCAGYIVDFECDGQPYGYVVLDASLDSLIAEYSVGPDVRNPGEVALDLAGDEIPQGDISECAVMQVDPISYGIIDSDDDVVLTNEGDVLSLDEVTGNEEASSQAENATTWNAVMIEPWILYRDYNVTASGHLDEFYSIDKYEIINSRNRYACMVTAFYAISAYYGVLDLHSDLPEYDRIWDYTGTTYIESEEDGRGQTRIVSGPEGFVRYLKSKGRSVSQATTTGKPDYSRFVSSVDGGNPSVMHVAIIKKKENGDGYEEQGHSMFVEGYITAASKNNLGGLKILIVFDGWNEGSRCVNYDFSRFTRFQGTFFRG